MVYTPHTTDEALQGRYGRTRSPLSRRAVLVTASILLAVFLPWGVWSISSAPAAGIETRDNAMEIVGDSVTLTYTVTAPVGTAVSCAVRALDSGFGVIGWVVEHHPASDETTNSYRTLIRSVGAPTAAGVDHCWRS